MAKAYPLVAPYRELRSALSELAAQRPGRRRRWTQSHNPVRVPSRTGRNQPSNSRFIFGPSVWLRGLIKPPPGHGVAYVDWAQQEFGIAAALSGDPAMQAAYNSGDPYLAFAKQAGRSAARCHQGDARSPARSGSRRACSACSTAWGRRSRAAHRAAALSSRRDLLRAHQETFPVFWRWSDAAVDHAPCSPATCTRSSAGGCTLQPASIRASLRNFPMQANGAEMMRLAACLATERGIEVCAPVHDAFLICAPLERLEADVVAMRAAMAEASREVLGGFELRHRRPGRTLPERYMDPRGAVMWDRVMRLIEFEQQQETAA